MVTYSCYSTYVVLRQKCRDSCIKAGRIYNTALNIMKRFIINIIAAHYHYWLRVQKRNYSPHIDTYYNIALVLTLTGMNLDLFAGGLLLYITLKIGWLTPIIAVVVSVEIIRRLLKCIFPDVSPSLSADRLRRDIISITRSFFCCYMPILFCFSV
jgi:hypothetical protein